MDQKYGIKELYNLVLKATSDIEIGNTRYSKGEVVLFIDKADIAIIDNASRTVSAFGGKGNMPLVSWTNNEPFKFELLIEKFSPETLAFINRGKVEIQTKSIPKVEILNPVKGIITLSETPLPQDFYIYRITENGYEKDLDYTIEENKVMVKNLDSYFISYYFLQEVKTIEFNGANENIFKLEAYTNYKNDNNAESRPLLIEMPKVTITSGLSFIFKRGDGPITQTIELNALFDKQERISGRFSFC